MTKKHTTITGKEMLIRDITTSHLKNTIAMIERNAKNGVKIEQGGGSDGDFWYDEYTVYGEDALQELNHADYVAEFERRIDK